MQLLGFDFKIDGNALVITRATPQATTPASYDRGNWWWPIIREPFTGAWQRNVELRPETLTSYFAVYSCIRLIATDIGKLRLRLMQERGDIETEVDVAAFSPVLRKPNHYQIRGKFIESWMISKLMQGNAYVLKERDQRGLVVRLYVLDPYRIKALVAPDGSVWYELPADNLSGLQLPVRVPASEIIHDVMCWLWHPLCGVSPLMAAALPVWQGLNIQKQSGSFFAKGSRPGGILTSPGTIDDTTAKKYKEYWETEFSGENAGRVAILSGGMKYEPMAIPAEQSQLIEQLKWTAENVCSVFGVPPFMIGIGPVPSFDNVEALNQYYYEHCLQHHIEAIESLLDNGLGLDKQELPYNTEFDLNDLLRMDTKTNIETTAAAVGASIFSINEARARFNLPPKPGGDTPLSQQQNWPIDVLAERPPPTVSPAAQLPPPAAADDGDGEDESSPNAERILAESRQYH